MAKRTYQDLETVAAPVRNTRRKKVAKVDRALRMINQLKREVEVKHLDTSITLVDATVAAPVVQVLSIIPQGATEVTRVGQGATPSKLDLRYQFDNDAISVDPLASFVARIVVIQSKQTFGAVLGPTGAGGVFEIADPLSAFQEDNRQHFVVLYDRMHVLAANTSAEKIVEQVTLFPKIRMTYENSATTAEAGSITLLAFTDGPSTYSKFKAYARLWYRDS